MLYQQTVKKSMRPTFLVLSGLPICGCGVRKNGIFINLGVAFSITTSVTHCGTVSCSRVLSLSPAASLTNNRQTVRPPTSLLKNQILFCIAFWQ